MQKCRDLIILGITGSIGKNAIKILEKWPEYFSLVGFSYHKNFKLASKIQSKFMVKHICCTNPNILREETEYWKKKNISFYRDSEALLDIPYNILLAAVVGSAGVKPVYKAAKESKVLLLANKESLVMAGKFIMQAAKENHTTIIPIDSEHNSVFRMMQAWQSSGSDHNTIKKIYLTASGGPLREFSAEQIKKADKKRILAHPNWEMGAKITVDSAGLINKSLEIIEAHHLFNRPYDELDAVIHPQSYIHAFLEYQDGTYFFHASDPDMLYPICHGLFYPDEPPGWISSKNSMIPTLNFDPIDYDKFPGFLLGIEAGKKGGAYPVIFNAANEEAVSAFLKDNISFQNIPSIIEIILEKNKDVSDEHTIDDLFEIDKWARSETKQITLKI